jgi:hypothetical protein
VTVSVAKLDEVSTVLQELWKTPVSGVKVWYIDGEAL